MSESISSTVKHSGLTLDSVFVEVQHSEGLGLPKSNHIRFFHTAMRGNRLATENLQEFIRRNLARYVFSRAQLENYRVNDDLDTAVSEAMRIMAENGDASAEGTGNVLDEVLIYAFLEEKLKAPNPITNDPGMTMASALSLLVFVLLYFPCIAAVVAIAREAGSWKWALFSFVYNTGVAWILSFIVYNISSLFI